MIPLYIIWNPDPVIFSISSFKLYWYPLMIFTGFMISYYFLRKIFTREGRTLKELESYAIFIILAIFVGGRLVHCLVYEPEYYLKFPLDIIKPWRGELGNGAKFTGIRGLSGHGSAAALMIVLVINARRTKMPVLWIFDRIALFGPLVGFFTRIGNLINSEILGSYSTLPWAFIFPRVNNMPRHPAQLYEALAYLAIFIIIFIYFLRHEGREKPGSILGLVLVSLYVCRFFIEFVKMPQTNVENQMVLNYGQILSIPFILFGLFLIFRPVRQNKPITA